ncbi:MAG: glycosyltransferase [Candidatus Dadabacteria bacterium]|nr:glycosyltransferase [Candidatus Dadabacteria bacterium]NIS08429.1 glycosyltransferase [Candidatus Dadabacteria bacterium]NIV41994.1 glycosyltransferase [Candidatus Dadabacteria bacterium]NIY21917.1 glycosyltransferase [Candidatus Dadabacteria bacterium]
MSSNKTSRYFTVIIPTFNREDFISSAVDSVLGQTFYNFELLIVDDGSTDNTAQMLNEYSDNRIRYFYQENRGISSARNKGIEESKGKYIAFLDSDDRWIPEKLERVSEYINKFPDIKIFHTNEVWYRNSKLLNQKKKHKKPDGYVYFHALPLCCVGMSTAVVKKELFDEIGKFDESLAACEDYDLWLRTTYKYEVRLIPDALTIKHGGRPDQLSSQHSLDKYRIASLDKILKSGVLNNEQFEKTREELIKKCKIYVSGLEKRKKLEEVKHYQDLIAKHS